MQSLKSKLHVGTVGDEDDKYEVYYVAKPDPIPKSGATIKLDGKKCKVLWIQELTGLLEKGEKKVKRDSLIANIEDYISIAVKF
jgi:hypothetical protein